MPEKTPVWFFLSRRHRLAYLQVPKVASTSMRAALCLLNHPELPRESVFSEEQLQQHREWHEMVRAETASLRGFFRFTFVRDPLARFASFYRNKIAQVAPESLRPRFQRMGLAAGMPIDSVLDVIERIPSDQLDPHLVPQSHLVFAGKKPRVDFIGRVEQFDEGLREIERRSGITLEIQRLNATAPKAATDSDMEYSAEIRARIARIYEEDLRRLDYPG
ncbi:MAG: sulfotransferase family protein [Chthoniobacteraceae bacterium]